MITEIKNYKLKEFLQLSEEIMMEYIEVLKHLKPLETKEEVYHLPLKDVEFIKENIEYSDDSIIEIIGIVQGYEVLELPKWLMKILPKSIKNYFENRNKRKVLNLKIIEFFGLINGVKLQINNIRKAEESSLISENSNMKWELVNGSERLQKFGIYNTLESLSEGDILKWKEIMNLSYSEVFIKLLMNKVNSDLQLEMQNIKTVKNV